MGVAKLVIEEEAEPLREAKPDLKQDQQTVWMLTEVKRRLVKTASALEDMLAVVNVSERAVNEPRVDHFTSRNGALVPNDSGGGRGRRHVHKCLELQ